MRSDVNNWINKPLWGGNTSWINSYRAEVLRSSLGNAYSITDSIWHSEIVHYTAKLLVEVNYDLTSVSDTFHRRISTTTF